MGIDYDSISEANPHIVYCSMSGYGQDVPYRDKLDHDENYIGYDDVLSLVWPTNSAPVIPAFKSPT